MKTKNINFLHISFLPLVFFKFQNRTQGYVCFLENAWERKKDTIKNYFLSLDEIQKI